MPTARPPDLLQGTLDMMILQTLQIGPNHGYGIARRIRQSSREILQIEEGSLYPALHRLAKRGYVTATWKQSETNRRAKYYRLTSKGRKQLAEKRRRWNVLSTAIDHVMGGASHRAEWT